ncbi:hypothetical protein NKG94_23350 [Micromonospora sp. M12]
MSGAPTSKPKPTPTPTESIGPTSAPTEESESTAAEETIGDVPADAAPPAASRPVSQSGGFGVVQTAFLLGGLLLSLGMWLLLRLRHLTRAATGEADDSDEPPVDRRWERPVAVDPWQRARR